MKKPILIALTAITTMTALLPVSAQIDGDYLSDQIERRRWEKLRKDQQEIAKKRRKSGTTKTRSPKSSQRKPVAQKAVVRNAQVQVNGKMLQSAVAPMQRGNHTFVPMREIFEALGATVTYDNRTRIVTAKRDGSGLQFRLEGGRRSDMKGSRVRLKDDESAFMHNGVVMVPLRLVAEKMGAKVAYIPRKTTPLISITSKTS